MIYTYAPQPFSEFLNSNRGMPLFFLKGASFHSMIARWFWVCSTECYCMKWKRKKWLSAKWMRQKTTQNVAHTMYSILADHSLSSNKKQIKRGSTSLIHRAFFIFLRLESICILYNNNKSFYEGWLDSGIQSGFSILGRKKTRLMPKAGVWEAVWCSRESTG